MALTQQEFWSWQLLQQTWMPFPFLTKVKCFSAVAEVKWFKQWRRQLEDTFVAVDLHVTVWIDFGFVIYHYYLKNFNAKTSAYTSKNKELLKCMRAEKW